MMKKVKKNTYDKLSILYNVLEIIRFICIVFVIVSLIEIFVGRKEQVEGTSMYPTLQNKESVFINVGSTFIKKVKRFDVVVVKNYRNNDLWVKRVIGMPGDTVVYKNDKLYINGEETKEPFLDEAYVKEKKKEKNLVNFTANYTSEKLKDDEYLLVGDNRPESLDSRNSNVGPFKREQIIADGVFVYYPLSEMRYVGNGGS